MAVDFQLRLPQRLDRRQVLLPQVLVEQRHQRRRRTIRHLPQAGDDVARAGEVEGALEPEGALAIGDVAQAGFTGGENGQFQAGQVEIDQRLAGDDAAARRLRVVGAGEDEPGHHHRAECAGADALTL